jgi:hypothetical protein
MKSAMALWLVPLLALAGQNDNRKSPAPRATGEITLRVIEASSSPNAANDAADLVPAELKTLLRYTRYRLLDSAYLRGTEDRTMTVTLAGNLEGRVEFEVRARQPAVTLEYTVEITGPPDPGKRRSVLLETETTARSGETVVLGASRMRDSANALIVLLTGKLL